MTDLVQLTCRVSSTNPDRPVGIEIWLDNDQIYNCEQVTEPVYFTHEFDDDEGQHVLRFVMKNKTAAYTTVDTDGTILTDSCICIENLSFDQIELGQIFIDHAVYEHDFNGTADTVKDQFFGTMGCNGTVSLSFTTPIYLWLLENM
jgi:hypothetical protein